MNESDSPRGRIALARAQGEERLARSENYADKFYRCLLCAACENICPSGAQAIDILQGARDDVAGHDLLPERLAQLDRAIAAEHNISSEENSGRLVWADNLPAPPSGLGKEQAELVYFVGCVGSFFPRSYSVPRSFVEILEAAGVDYALLGGQEWCCGYPQYINGELDLAEEAMRHNVDGRPSAAGQARGLYLSLLLSHLEARLSRGPGRRAGPGAAAHHRAAGPPAGRGPARARANGR